MNYYSEAGQDVLLKKFFDLEGIEKGFFLDVGSTDGIYISNTYLLEQNEWNGICVEAHPDYAKILEKNRPNSICYHCAAGDEDKNSCDFNSNYRGSLSSLDFTKESYFQNNYTKYYGNRNESKINGITNGKIQVPMRKLDSILQENNINKVDVISIDVDGSEPLTLKGLTLQKWSPRILILEDDSEKDLIYEYAKNNGYKFSRRVGSDLFFCNLDSDVEKIQSLSIVGSKIERPHPSEIYFNRNENS